jgi:D-amino-acid dehydrogenase
LDSRYGIDYAVLTAAQLRQIEPHLSAAIVGAIHFRGSPSSPDPGMLTKAYADLFGRKGGRFCKGDARRPVAEPSGWSLATEASAVDAREAVVALGPWSDDVFRPLGYEIPLAVKRGYHMQYRAGGNATLGHPVRNADGGFALASMSKGIRPTTGVEFADRDVPPSPVQLARDEPLARDLFPLAERLEHEPWLGRRPCLPDMLPVIGKGQRHQGLWFAFGHAHHGFTLGPVTGRLLAELMTCQQPFTDPTCYAAARFGNRSRLTAPGRGADRVSTVAEGPRCIVTRPAGAQRRHEATRPRIARQRDALAFTFAYPLPCRGAAGALAHCTCSRSPPR